MSVASELICRSKGLGVSLLIVGDKLRLRSIGQPPDDLVEGLREHKAEVVAELERPDTDGGRPAASSCNVARPAPGTPKQDLVRDAIEALKLTRQNQVRFHLEGDDVRIEHSPQVPAHVLGRFRKASKGITSILLCPIRPWGYSNETWLEAVLDAERLGYPFKWPT
jgi:hypothetical protein